MRLDIVNLCAHSPTMLATITQIDRLLARLFHRAAAEQHNAFPFAPERRTHARALRQHPQSRGEMRASRTDPAATPVHPRVFISLT